MPEHRLELTQERISSLILAYLDRQLFDSADFEAWISSRYRARVQSTPLLGPESGGGLVLVFEHEQAAVHFILCHE